MEYIILGVSAHCQSDGNLSVFVAWQSNLPAYSFTWRCTCKHLDHQDIETLTPEEIRDVAARGDDISRPLAKKLFPFLPAKSHTF